MSLSKLNIFSKIINFQLNDKWLLCALCKAGTLLDATAVVSQQRQSPGLWNNSMLTQLAGNDNWQMAPDGGFDLVGEGRECFPEEGINWSYSGQWSFYVVHIRITRRMTKTQIASPLSQCFQWVSLE